MNLGKTIVLGTAIGFVVALAGCATGLSVTYKTESNVLEDITGTGFGYGPQAKEMAEKAAITDATALAEPKAVEFTLLRAEPYEMFRLDLAKTPAVELKGSENLPDGRGVVATALASRSSVAQKDMRYATSANFSIECRGKTFASRVEKCQTRAFEEAVKYESTKKFSRLPNKVKGAFTFYTIKRHDDGTKMTVEVAVNVSFLGAGELTPQETILVLRAAWRDALAQGRDEKGLAIFQQAIKLCPKAEDTRVFATEFALYEMGKNRLDNAIMAIKEAIRINGYQVEPYKILYQLYKRQGDTKHIEEMTTKLKELEVWDEDPGADLTNNFKYDEKVKWSDGKTSDSPGSTIRFHEVDESEDQAKEK